MAETGKKGKAIVLLKLQKFPAGKKGAGLSL